MGVLSFYCAMVITLVQAHLSGSDIGINDIATWLLSWGVSLFLLHMFAEKWDMCPLDMDLACLKRYYLRVQGLLNTTKKEDLQNDSYF